MGVVLQHVKPHQHNGAKSLNAALTHRRTDNRRDTSAASRRISLANVAQSSAPPTPAASVNILMRRSVSAVKRRPVCARTSRSAADNCTGVSGSASGAAPLHRIDGAAQHVERALVASAVEVELQGARSVWRRPRWCMRGCRPTPPTRRRQGACEGSSGGAARCQRVR